MFICTSLSYTIKADLPSYYHTVSSSSVFTCTYVVSHVVSHVVCTIIPNMLLYTQVIKTLLVLATNVTVV